MNEVEKAIEEASGRVDEEWRRDFRSFVEDGTARPEFIDFLDGSQECQQAVEAVFDAQAKTIQREIGSIQVVEAAPRDVRTETARPERVSAKRLTDHWQVGLSAVFGLLTVSCVLYSLALRATLENQKVQITSLKSERDSFLAKASGQADPDSLVSDPARMTHLISVAFQMSSIGTAEDVVYEGPMDDYQLMGGDYPDWFNGLRTLTRKRMYHEIYALKSSYEKHAESHRLGARAFVMLGVATKGLWEEAIGDGEIEFDKRTVTADELFREADGFFANAFKRGLALDDEVGQMKALSNRGNLLLTPKTLDQAREFLVQARSLDPLAPNPLYNLLCYHSLTENLEKCQELYEEFYAIESNTLAGLREVQNFPREEQSEKTANLILQLKDRVRELRILRDHMSNDRDLNFFLNSRPPVEAADWKFASR